MLKKIFPVILFLAIFLSCVFISNAAGPPPGPPMGPPPCWPPPCTIPLDGGISLLIVAGVSLAGKKIYDFRKRSD